MPTIRDLLAILDARYPLARAESWDKVGLQIGDGAATVSRVLVAHEVTAQTLDEAEGYKAGGCDALVVYHPPLFRPLENLDFSNHAVRLAARCIAQNLVVVAVHTALDNAPSPHALGDRLAQSLDLQNIEVLKPSGREALCKIVVFTPPEALQQVSEALWQAGAGHIGNYDQASFRTRGTGTFRPLPDAQPAIGSVGKDEEVDEWRLEVIVPDRLREEAVRAMKAAHPYEEVAYDVYPLHNATEPYGAARMGEIEPASLGQLARAVTSKLNAPNVRLVAAGEKTRAIARVACVPGSGWSYVEAAARAGCDCLVTGDIKHHDALLARSHGLSLIDATHTATERAAVSLIADALQDVAGLEVRRSAVDTNPFEALGDWDRQGETTP